MDKNDLFMSLHSAQFISVELSSFISQFQKYIRCDLQSKYMLNRNSILYGRPTEENC